MSYVSRLPFAINWWTAFVSLLYVLISVSAMILLVRWRPAEAAARLDVDVDQRPGPNNVIAGGGVRWTIVAIGALLSVGDIGVAIYFNTATNLIPLALALGSGLVVLGFYDRLRQLAVAAPSRAVLMLVSGIIACGVALSYVAVLVPGSHELTFVAVVFAIAWHGFWLAVASIVVLVRRRKYTAG